MQKELSQKKQFPGKEIWKAHLQAWRKSGLSGMGYCRQQNLSYHAFNYWKKKCHQSSPPGISLVPVPTKRVMVAEAISSPGSPLKVEVGNRFKIEVNDDFSPKTLAKILSTLKAYR